VRFAAFTASMLFAAAAIAPASAGTPATIAPENLHKDEMLLRADKVVYDSDDAVTTASGHVEIDYDNSIVMADRVVYDQNADKVVAIGHVVVLDRLGNAEFSNQATLTNKMRDGVLQGFSALIGTNGRLAGTYATRKGGVRTVATRAVYSNCKICNQPGQRTPVWQVEAARVTYDEPAHRIFYNDAIVDAFGIPILYTPFFTHSDPTVKRSSGILMPEIGESSTLGYYARIPVYISLNDSQDFTIAPLLTTQDGTEIEGEYRERWNDGGFWLQPSVAENPRGGFLNNQYQIYSSLFGAGVIPISDAWHAGFQVQLASDETYLERYKISQADELVNDLFVEGISGRSRFAITGYFFQGLIATDNNSQYPVVLPLIEYTYIPEGDLFGGQFRFDVNTAAISRQTGEDDQRLTGEFRWQLPLVTADGQLITLATDARGDVYHIDNPQTSLVPTTDHYISRGLPFAAIDWRWPFVTASASGQTSYVVEPIAQIIGAPYGGNPSGIPNEDSSDFQFDETDIFSFDRLPGYDVVETGPRSNVGFRTQAIYPTGSVEFLVGQEFRLKPDPIFAPDSGVSGTQSDIVSRLTVDFLPHFSATERVEFDTKTDTLSRNEVYLDAQFGRSSLEVSYLKLPQEEVTLGLPTREEVNAQALIGLWKYWLVYAAAQRNLADGTMIAAEFGFGYDDECLGISLSYRREYTTDQDIPPSTDVLVRFNLKTSDVPADQPTQLFPQHLYSHIAL
jgi:LPS-assembly protein